MILAIQGMEGESAWATTSESRTGSSGRWEKHWQGRAQVSVGLQATPALQGALDHWWCARAVEPMRLLSKCNWMRPSCHNWPSVEQVSVLRGGC